MSDRIQDLHPKKRTAGFEKLRQFGVDAKRWLAMLDADDATMQRLATVWQVCTQRYAYDATAIFGFGHPSEEDLPEAKSGEIIIRYGGWSLQELCDCPLVCERNVMWHEQDWYGGYAWSTDTLPSGIYRLRVPVPDSYSKTFDEQKRLLPVNEEPAPVVLVASALLAHRVQTGEDLLKNDWTRCREQAAGGVRVGLGWDEGRLGVGSCWDGVRCGFLWSSSVRTS